VRKTADRKNLVRPQRVVHDSSNVIDVDDVSQKPSVRVPEAFDEREARALGGNCP
jgi:hypothetical protein